MFKRFYNRHTGYTLLLMMLILSIIAIIFTLTYVIKAGQRAQSTQDNFAMEFQGIMSAASSYYITSGNSAWPLDSDTPTSLGGSRLVPNYLPANMKNPWGNEFFLFTADPIGPDVNSPFSYDQAKLTGVGPAGVLLPVPNKGLLYIYSEVIGVGSANIARAVAGGMPFAYTSADRASSPPKFGLNCDSRANSCFVVAAIMPPKYNLSSSANWNYSTYAHHGDCIPVPPCPVDKLMSPQIMVAPVAVSGRDNDISINMQYPLNAFSAYATKGQGGNFDGSPLKCVDSDSPSVTPPPEACPVILNNPRGQFWRVCLRVVTEKGEMNTNTWKNSIIIFAATRCAISGESTGSFFTGYEQSPGP